MPQFTVGEKVRVLSQWPPSPPIHCRTPYYIRGYSGIIERYCGDFPNPEELAFGREEPKNLSLYRVRFKQSDLWDSYQGGILDMIDIEIYENWLEKL